MSSTVFVDKYARAFSRRAPEAHASRPSAAEQIAAAGTDAVAAYRKRRADILSLPEAKGRKGLAETLIEGELSIVEAQAVLAAAPTDAMAKSDAIAKRVVANHRGEPPPGHEPTATAKRVISQLRSA